MKNLAASVALAGVLAVTALSPAAARHSDRNVGDLSALIEADAEFFGEPAAAGFGDEDGAGFALAPQPAEIIFESGAQVDLWFVAEFGARLADIRHQVASGGFVGTGSISASPQYVLVPTGGLGSTVLSWTTSGTPNAEVWVGLDDAPEVCVTEVPLLYESGSDGRVAHCAYALPDSSQRATLAAIPTKRMEAVERMLAV